jgi:hypothetical protein
MSKTALAAAAAYSAGKNRSSNTMKDKPSTIRESIAMKPLAWLIIAGGVGFVIYKAGKGLSAAFKEFLKGRDFNQELANKSKTRPATYTATQYKIYADNLFDAFTGPGTDESRVRAVFAAMKSDTDVLELIKAYGTRDGGAYWYSPKMTLIEQIPYDLTDSEIATYVNAPLTANGVSYKF